MSSILYLSSPYSHPNASVRQNRFDAACRVAGRLMEEGYIVFSPIAHSHPIGQIMGKALDHEFWMRQCIALLRKSDEFAILTIDGWEMSKGIQQELEMAKLLHIPVREVKDD